MALDRPFQNQSNAITSFSFSDIVSGKSFKTFYGMESVTGLGTASYQLFPEPIFSNLVVKSVDTTNATFSKLIDLNFDTKFDIPQIISGLAICNTTTGIASTTGTNDGTMKVIANVYGGDGTTFLVSGGSAVTTMTDAAQVDVVNAIELDIPRTPFPIGDVLRLNVEVWGNRTGGSGDTDIGLALDPSGRPNPNAGSNEPIDTTADTSLPTTLTLTVPFIPGDL